MTLDELQEKIEKDMKLNDTELDLESLKTPQLHNKYMKQLNNFKLLLSRAEADLATIKKDKWEIKSRNTQLSPWKIIPSFS